MSKRTLESFFSPPEKRSKTGIGTTVPQTRVPLNNGKVVPDALEQRDDLAIKETYRNTSHETYPFPIADLPSKMSEKLDELLLEAKPRTINDQPHLDLLYFQPLIPQHTADELFKFLRAHLPFYRVKYAITRFGKTIDINTPRYTTVFGVDETSRFLETHMASDKDLNVSRLTTRIVEASDESKEVAPGKYKSCTVPPRPIPPCLAMLKNLTEALTSDTYNFVLVNYYSNGQDSISYHSDDERFLGEHPTIASFSLGARRDFLMKHKPLGAGPGNGNQGKPKGPTGEGEKGYPGTTPIKLPLGSGDMVLMRGETQRNWLHSIPKRTGKSNEADRGRINITMRKAMVPAGSENYYQYNVGRGPVYRWDERRHEMKLWEEADRK